MASYASTTINNSNQNSNHHIHLLSSKYLVLSADFVIDQDNFWNPSYISISVIKMWKHLHKNYFVIWVIRREKVFKEIKEFVKMNCLPLHAIFYMKNKRRYVNNYLPLQFKI